MRPLPLMKRKANLPVPVDPKLYDNAYYEGSNRGYTQFTTGASHPVFSEALDAAFLSPGDSVLDIGCGRGEFLALCAKKGCRGVGIDYSENAVQIANDSLGGVLGTTERALVTCQVMNAKALRFADRSFDRVVMLDIVEHLHPYELDQVYREAWRVLKPTGKLIVHTNPNAFCMMPVRWMAGLIGIKLKSTPFHVNEQTIFSLRSQLAPLFQVEYTSLRQDINFWYNGTIGRPERIRRLARLVDGLLDHGAIRRLISNTPIKYFIFSDIWVVARKREKTNE